MRKINRLSFVGAIVLTLMTLGLVLRHGEILILTLPFITFLIAGIYLGFSNKDVSLRAERTLDFARVYSKDKVKVVVEIINEGRSLAEVQLIDNTPSDLTVVDGETKMITSLGAGDRVSLEYTVRADRGRFEFENMKTVVTDSLGFNSLELMLDCPADLLVTPRFEELREITIQPRRTKVYSGVVKARLGGTGVEFFGNREYYQGDEFRWIDWNSTARHGKLITTEFEQERVADVGLILDARERSDIEADGESLFEYSVQAAASLARFFIKEGNRVGLLIYGRFLDWTFPGYGRLQLMKVMEALTNAGKGDKAIFAGLENVPRRLFPAGSQIVLVSPLMEKDVPVLKKLRALYSVIVVSPNPLNFELSGLKKSNEVRLAARIAQLKRELMLNRLREAGVRVVDWDVSKPLKGEAKRALSQVLR